MLAIMSMLRDKDFGCPWDLEQSLSSLIPHTLEEAYEVVDAIDSGDMLELKDELGDLLFQVVFYAQIASEDELFRFDDVAGTICRKLIRRHPHVFPKGNIENFGSRAELSPAQVEINWDAIKREEKAERLARSGELSERASSKLDGVPAALPALQRAQKLQDKAAKVGFDWQEIEPVIGKLKEEVGELEEAIVNEDEEAIEAEFGDVLFSLVNLARHKNVRAEVALRTSNRRFENRFRWIEKALREQNQDVSEVDLSELDKLWNQAKDSGL